MREDVIQPNWIEMFKLMHAHKNGTPVDEVFHEIMVNNWLSSNNSYGMKIYGTFSLYVLTINLP